VDLVDDPTISRSDTPDVPLDWPRRYPYHPSFGPRSTVSVPMPAAWSSESLSDDVPMAPPLEGDSSPLDALSMELTADHGAHEDNSPDIAGDIDGTSSDDDIDVIDYSIRDRDRDLSRGMGSHLRLPVPPTSTGSKRRHDHTTSDFPLVVPVVAPPPLETPPPRASSPALPNVSSRTLRSRIKVSPTIVPPVGPTTKSRVPVHQRWTYEPALPVPTPPTPHSHPPEVLSLASSVPLPLPLCPRQPWMLEDDPRSDSDAESAWRLATQHLSSPHCPW
jgi:hypothetical protein